MNAEDRLLENGYDGVKYLKDFSYDSALIGVTSDGRAVYDYELMVEWLIDNVGMSWDEASDWVSYYTISALSYLGEDAPIVLFPLEDTKISIKDLEEEECL